MPWSLEIFHIGLTGTGDATLIVATFQDDAGVVLKRSSLLIDGGRLEAAGMVQGVLAAYGINNDFPLRAVAITHYDADHFYGVRDLIDPPRKRRREDMYRDVRVYDRGRTDRTKVIASKSRSRGQNIRIERDTNSDETAPYGYNLGDAQDRNLVTGGVLLNPDWRYFQTPEPNPFNDERVKNARLHPPYWLIGQEVLWGGENLDGFDSNSAPRVVCISANNYHKTANNEIGFINSVGLTADQNENINSLAFLLTFGNFRYFLGGDLESTQEDALIPYFQTLQNGGGPLIHAMKASHHGSNLSSSQNFLTSVRPNVVIFSCGQDNQFPHPHKEVIGRMGVGVSYYNTGENWRLRYDESERAFVDQFNRRFEYGSPKIAGLYPRDAHGNATQAMNVSARSHILLRVSQGNNGQSPTHFYVGRHAPTAGDNLRHLPNYNYADFDVFVDEFPI